MTRVLKTNSAQAQPTLIVRTMYLPNGLLVDASKDMLK